MNKKKIIIISLATLIFLVVVLIVLLPKNEQVILNNSNEISNYEPEFMDANEKSGFGLPEDSKIQVLKRGDGGIIEVYKIIRGDNDIEYNIEAIGQ